MTSNVNGRFTRRGGKPPRLDDIAIKSAIREIDMRGALEFYGVKFNQQGAALCPFHKEKTASFRTKGKFWHCFGCGITGDLIKFVQMRFNMAYPQALETIQKDFGISGAAPTIADQERMDRIRLEQYYSARKYAEMLNHRDLCIDIYLYAADVLDYVVRYCGGASLDNESYVNAQFNVLKARAALEEAEHDCAVYLKENPSATPRPPVWSSNGATVQLPPAPKVMKNTAKEGGEQP